MTGPGRPAGRPPGDRAASRRSVETRRVGRSVRCSRSDLPKRRGTSDRNELGPETVGWRDRNRISRFSCREGSSCEPGQVLRNPEKICRVPAGSGSGILSVENIELCFDPRDGVLKISDLRLQAGDSHVHLRIRSCHGPVQTANEGDQVEVSCNQNCRDDPVGLPG